MAITYTCDYCGDELKDSDVITITVERAGETTASHVDQSCFDAALGGDDEAISAVLLG